MAAGKVNFTSSILSDMTAKAAAFQENKQPEQVVTTTKKQDSEPVVSASAENTADKPKNNVKRNTIVGLSAVAILIGLGVAGRKGKLGPKLQKFLGGAEHATPRNTDNVSGIVADSAGAAKTPEIKPNRTKVTFAMLDENIKKEIEIINSEINKSLPKIDERLMRIEYLSKEKGLQLVNKELKTIKLDPKLIEVSECIKYPDETLIYFHSEGGWRYTIGLYPDKTIKSFTKRRNSDLSEYFGMSFGKGKEFAYELGEGSSRVKSYHFDEKGCLCEATQTLSSSQKLLYNSDGSLDCCIIEASRPVVDNRGNSKYYYTNTMTFKNDKISEIEYSSTKTGERVKKEILDSSGNVVQEKYIIDGNEVIVDL